MDDESQRYAERLDTIYATVTDDTHDTGQLEELRERYADGPVHEMTRSDLRSQVRDMMADAYDSGDRMEVEACARAASTLRGQIEQYPVAEDLEERRDPAADIEEHLRETAVPTSGTVEDPERVYRRLEGSLRADYAEPESMLDEIAHLGNNGELPEETTGLARLTSLVGL